MQMIAASFCGLIFGTGLIVSGMAQPAKVLNFLDLFGNWDPSLAFVMAAALAVTGAGNWIARSRTQPLVATQFYLPGNSAISANLLFGSILFGIGWGLSGLCPGPALVNLASLSPQLIVFVIAMAAGIILHDIWSARRAMREAMATADG